MEQWITLIQELGFPIIISFYLLHRIETSLKPFILFSYH